MEVVKKVQLEENIKTEKCKLEEIRDNQEYDDGIREEIKRRIEKYNDELKTRQESINLLNPKGTGRFLADNFCKMSITFDIVAQIH